MQVAFKLQPLCIQHNPLKINKIEFTINNNQINMQNNSIISLCGDICSECPRYIATKANNLEKLTELANLWFRLGFRTKVVCADDMKCNGCSKCKPCSYNINSCEHIQDLENCGECKLYPCEKINLVFEKTDKINEICLAKCSENEYDQLRKAFLLKREVLDEINRKFITK